MPGAVAWRWNAVLGKIVPVLLLVYLVLAYRLVVVDYTYKRLYASQGRRGIAAAYGTILHLFLLPTLWAYFCIFLARPVQWKGWTAGWRATVFPEAPLPSPPVDVPDAIKERRIIFECDEHGEPIRCHRDQCGGRWKPARSRHCGDCRQCRVALDHHCAWFDADVSAPHTLLPFLLFLSLVPPLLLSAFSPLLGTSYRHGRFIWNYASRSPYVDSIWWSRKRSWMGGPMHRWLIGLWLGSRECCRTVDDPFESPNLFVPLLLALALGFILITSFLLLSTALQISKGDLSIDVAIQKSLRRRNVPAQLKARRFFWVPLSEEQRGGTVVPYPSHEQPYDLGSWKDNMRALLCLPPYTMDQLQLQWPISPSVRAQLNSQAQHQASKDR